MAYKSSDSFIWIEESDLKWAVSQKLLNENQAQPLWEALNKRAQGRGGFNFANLAFYFGFSIILGSVTFFIGQFWSSQPILMVLLAFAYVLGFGYAGIYYWKNYTRAVPQTVAGIFCVISTLVVPIFVVSVRVYFNIQPLKNLPGLYEEVPTLIASILFIYRAPFPFLTAPLAGSTYALVITLLNYVDSDWDSTTIYLVTLVFGSLMTTISRYVALKKSTDFGWWGYLFGATAIAISINGLTWDQDSSELEKFIYVLVNVGLMIISVVLSVQIFLIYGSLGVFSYLSYLSWKFFENTWYFPLILTAIGLLIIYIGTKISKITNKSTEDQDQLETQSPPSYAQPLIDTSSTADHSQNFPPLQNDIPMSTFVPLQTAQVPFWGNPSPQYIPIQSVPIYRNQLVDNNVQ